MLGMLRQSRETTEGNFVSEAIRRLKPQYTEDEVGSGLVFDNPFEPSDHGRNSHIFEQLLIMAGYDHNDYSFLSLGMETWTILESFDDSVRDTWKTNEDYVREIIRLFLIWDSSPSTFDWMFKAANIITTLGGGTIEVSEVNATLQQRVRPTCRALWNFDV